MSQDVTATPRRRPWLKRLAFMATALLVLVIITLLTMLYTRPGLSLALALAKSVGGVDVEFVELEGSLADLQGKGLKLQLGQTTIKADTIALSWSPAGLLGAELEIRKLSSHKLVVTLPPADEPDESSGPPKVAPPQSLALPVEIVVQELSMTDTRLIPVVSEPRVIPEIKLSASLKQTLWQISQLQVELAEQALSLTAQTTPRWPYRHELSVSVNSTDPDNGLNLQWQTRGDIESSSGTLSGNQAGHAIELAPLDFGLKDQRWQLQSAGSAGPLSLNLSAALDGEQLFAADLQIIHPSPTETASATVQVQASGAYNSLKGQFQASARGLEQTGDLAASSQFSFVNFSQLKLIELQVLAADGRINGDAELWLEQPLRAQAQLTLADLNLARLHPQLSGVLQGNLNADSRLADGEPQTLVDLQLSSSGLSPAISLNGRVLMAGPQARSGELRLDAGANNQLTLSLTSPQQLSADIAVSELQTLWPDIRGSISAQLRANPQQLISIADQPETLIRDGVWPPLLGAVNLREVGFGEYKVDTAQLNLSPETSSLDLTGLDLGTVKITQTQFSLDGPPVDHRFDLNLSSDLGRLNLAGSGQWQTDQYNYQLQTLQLAPIDLPELTNDQPWRGSLSRSAQSLNTGCLSGSGVKLCLMAEASPDNLNLDTELALAEQGLAALNWRRWWPTAPAGLKILSPVSLQASVARSSGQDQINLQLMMAGMEIPAPEGSPGAESGALLQPLRDLNLVVEGSSQSADVSLHAGFADGTLTANGVLTELLEQPQMDIVTNLSADHLDMLSALLPEIDLHGGPLAVNLTAVGPAAAPAVSGTAQVQQVTVDVPGLNISPLLDFTVNLPSAGGGTFRGTIKSGEGRGELSGSAALGETLTLAVNLKGEDLLIADSDALSLAASPDLSVRVDGAVTRVNGEVVINEGLVALTAASSGVSASPDVIIVDASQPTERVVRSGSELDVRVRIPKPLPVTGYGLKGDISGSLRVRQKIGGVMLGNGQLLLTGSYDAFGQKLTIERGALNYVETPLNDPAIDFFAFREVGDAKVGVRVTGRASSLSAVLESEPAMNESDQLALLVLGERNGSGLDESQSDRLSSAALGLALSQGNKRLGALGENGSLPQVSLTQELGGLAVAIGKQISPNLYIGYTVDLLEPIQLIRLRYRISDLWTAESELGQESRVAFRYRLER